jgi:hypothetical protein
MVKCFLHSKPGHEEAQGTQEEEGFLYILYFPLQFAINLFVLVIVPALQPLSQRFLH